MLLVECGKGLYVRTLLHDIGQRLGCGGHMSFLLRISAGSFEIDHAVTTEELLNAGGIARLLLPIDAPIGHLPRVDVGAEHEAAIRNGNPVRAAWLREPIERAELPQRVYLNGVFAGMGEAQPDGSVRFRAMLLPDSL